MIYRIEDLIDWKLISPDAKTCCHKHTNQNIKNMFMILCPDCGHKRCPKASDCELVCTNSNNPGQIGSVYQKFE